jgi:hypothetical protein
LVKTMAPAEVEWEEPGAHGVGDGGGVRAKECGQSVGEPREHEDDGSDAGAWSLVFAHVDCCVVHLERTPGHVGFRSWHVYSARLRGPYHRRGRK